MHTHTHSLRVVIVWRSTILQERTFTQTSDPVITVGEADDNLFSVFAPGLPDAFEMFERGEHGYTLRFTDRVDGVLQIGDEDWSIDQLIDKERAWEADKVRTKKGAARSFELELATGDWGRLRLGDVHIFFQLIEQKEAVAGRGLGAVEAPLVATVLLAGLLHLAVLLTAFLAFEPASELAAMTVPDSFAEFAVEDVKDPPEPVDDEVPSEETSSKKAGGEEGKFGDPDKVVENEVPKHDGKMVDEKIDPAKVGVLEALSSPKLGQGAVAAMFDQSQGISNDMEVAFAGDDAEFRLGRGNGGLGIRGLDKGGGGDGFGRIQGIGGVDTGGGPGGGPSTGADLKKKPPREVEPHYVAKTPKVGDFCDKTDIRRVVSAKANAIKYCFERQLQRKPELSGKIIAQWKVGLDGKVINASIASSTMGSRAVEGCIQRVVSRMRFAKPDGGICVINYPFVFTGLE